MQKGILISAKYLELLQRTFVPGEIVAVNDFGRFLDDLKWRLKKSGKDEAFNDLIREEIHMMETKDGLV